MERPTMKPRPAAASSGLLPIANPTLTSLQSFHPKSKPEVSTGKLITRQQEYRLLSRRNVSLLSLLALAPSPLHPAPANAFSIGISGPKDWLKEQKKKSSKFVLAPIDASREILRSAYRLLSASESNNDYTKKELEEVQSLVRSSARDCVPQVRNSFVAFQANTGVEVCTFQLIVKNASSLLDKKDPVKLEAEAKLNDLIRSFTSLNGLANEIDIQLSSNRQKVADALMDTISSLNKFEQGVKDCLDI